MKWHKKISQETQHVLSASLKTAHGRIVLCGLLVGLCYFPVWLGFLMTRAADGSPGLLLVLAVVYLGLNELWKQRQQLVAVTVSDEDRLLGHVLVFSGALLFPFCRFAIWSQALLWLLVLVGIACSTWGISFFKKYALSTFLMMLSVYPRPNEMLKILLDTFTAPRSLDHFAAWTGSLALRAIGQPAVLNGVYISLPQGSVEVGWACNGFSMAVNVAVMGLVLGLFLKQKAPKVVMLVTVGGILAYVLNIPRIMLLTYASAYWGPYWFDFWHHSWGAQLFVGLLFTVYYYVAMWLVDQSFRRARV